MEIISHRGFWLDSVEKNSLIAFERSFTEGFGFETDIRDYNGKLVISHDIPIGNEMLFDDFVKIFPKSYSSTLALNIKSDGLAESINNVLKNSFISNWFVFDMSVPDMVNHIKFGNPFFTRVSEFEKEPLFYENALGIWLDAFVSNWYTEINILKWLNDKKKICIVSPELHSRDHFTLWSMLKNSNLHFERDIILCTDFPTQAKKYFFQI
jgi:hypothetical protein